MATAGRILIIPKGDWNTAESYEMLDLVNHNGTSWLAKKHSQGIAPSTETGEYWFNLMGVITKEVNIANNLATTEEGFALDARQGKVLMDALYSIDTEVDNVSSKLEGFFPKLVARLGCGPEEKVYFTPEEYSLYIVINAHVHWTKTAQMYMLICQPDFNVRSVYIGGAEDTLTFTEQDGQLVIYNSAINSGLRLYLVKIGYII